MQVLVALLLISVVASITFLPYWTYPFLSYQTRLSVYLKITRTDIYGNIWMFILKAATGTVANFSYPVIYATTNRSVAVSKINNLLKNVSDWFIRNIIMSTIIIFHIGTKLNFSIFITIECAENSTLKT